MFSRMYPQSTTKGEKTNEGTLARTNQASAGRIDRLQLLRQERRTGKERRVRGALSAIQGSIDTRDKIFTVFLVAALVHTIDHGVIRPADGRLRSIRSCAQVSASGDCRPCGCSRTDVDVASDALQDADNTRTRKPITVPRALRRFGGILPALAKPQSMTEAAQT